MMNKKEYMDIAVKAGTSFARKGLKKYSDYEVRRTVTKLIETQNKVERERMLTQDVSMMASILDVKDYKIFDKDIAKTKADTGEEIWHIMYVFIDSVLNELNKVVKAENDDKNSRRMN